ncbi:transposase [Streptomyces diastaticus]|uniref:IS66 family transposase n=1 Tax=Streptomyces diastaticus TaxID=1956 RepID=UPI0033E16F40
MRPRAGRRLGEPDQGPADHGARAACGRDHHPDWPDAALACTEFLTLLHLALRSRAGADAGGVLPHYRDVLIHDALSLYAGCDACAHQLRGPHLVRELTATEEDVPDQRWHQQICCALAGLNRQALRARSGEIHEIAPEAPLLHLRAFHQRVKTGLSEHPRSERCKQTTARNLLERLRDEAHAVLRYADDPLHVPFTNNCGERALQPVETQLKISGCQQPEHGATAWLTVRSYLDSARKHGLSAFHAIHRQPLDSTPSHRPSDQHTSRTVIDQPRSC